MKFLPLLLGLFLSVSSANATVLIYKGTTKNQEKPSQLTPNRSVSYLLFEPETKRIVFVHVFGKGRRAEADSEPVQTVRVSSINVSNGKQATAIHSTTATDLGPSDFLDSLVYLRGTNGTLPIDSTGTVRQHPRVIQGQRTTIQTEDGIGRYKEERFVFTLSKKRTQTANDGSQDIVQARDALLGDLNGNR